MLGKKDASASNGTINWSVENLRLPVYSRYQSSLVFSIGKASGVLSTLGVSSKPDAMAILWLQDLQDDIEQEVKIPVVVSDDINTLKLNVINDQTKKHHDFKVVGMLTARIKLDSGLDEDHEVRVLPPREATGCN